MIGSYSKLSFTFKVNLDTHVNLHPKEELRWPLGRKEFEEKYLIKKKRLLLEKILTKVSLYDRYNISIFKEVSDSLIKLKYAYLDETSRFLFS